MINFSLLLRKHIYIIKYNILFINSSYFFYSKIKFKKITIIINLY